MTLLAIGGGMDPAGLLPGVFLQLCGGSDARIVILPTASELPDAGGSIHSSLTAAGLRRAAQIVPLRRRSDSEKPEIISALQNADGIFLCGGDQLRLTAALLGTPAGAVIQQAGQRGCVIAGTSAGAAALGAIMIARGSQGQAPRCGSAVLSPGLGLEPRLLFDQHFNQRNRLGRLIFALTASPSLIGIGVDEDTAALVDGDQIEVIGRGGATIVDASRLAGSNISELKGRELLAVSGIVLHVLTHGSRFHLRQRTAEIYRSDTGGA